MSVGGIDLFHAMYRPLLFDTIKVDPGDADELEFVLAGYQGEIAAVIMEPLVQGAAGHDRAARRLPGAPCASCATGTACS